MKQYYYLSPDRTQQGPVSGDRLYALLAAGVVNANTLVWCEGMSGWQALGTVLPPSSPSPAQPAPYRAPQQYAPYGTPQQVSPYGAPRQSWAPQQARLSCWEYFVQCVTAKYATFSGRATRKEYWGYQLFLFIFLLAYFVLNILIAAVAGEGGDNGVAVPFVLLNIIFCVGFLAIIVPTWAVTVRRLHDANYSGWCVLLSLIPWIGGIILLVFCLQDSYRGTNQYGPSEKYPD